MKPMGGHKTQIENNHQDWRVKGKIYKKYKRMERQNAKRKIKKEISVVPNRKMVDSDWED